MTSIFSVRFALFALAVLLVGACGSGGQTAPAADDVTPRSSTETDPGDGDGGAGDPGQSLDADAGFPLTVTHEGGETTLDAPPQAIVSLSPTSTEILYAIGAGDQVVAVDHHSNYPQGTPITDLSGFEPNVEAIAELGPDLVVVSGDRNDVVAGLATLDIPVVVHGSATSFDDVTDQIVGLGRLTGHSTAAAQLASDLLARLDELAARAPAEADALTYYHELSDGYYTVTSATFIGQLYGLLGLTSIADDVPEAGGGFPQLAAEYIIEADPDLIFLAYDADVSQRPGWEQLTAVRDGHVIALDPDIASRWGPRIVEQVETVLDALISRHETAVAR